MYLIFWRISPSPFLNFWWSKVWGGGLYDEHKTKTVFQNQNFGIHPYDQLDDVAVDFLFDEVSEPEDITDFSLRF